MSIVLILDGIVEKFQSYVEPYNTVEAVPKFNLIRAGQAMCGSDIAFCEWHARTFGKPLAQFPRDLVDELLFWMSSLSIVTSQTLRIWADMGRAKYPDFDKRQYGIVFSATHKRTKFPPLMTEEEALAMINQWMIGPLPPPVEITPISFLDLSRVPQPLYPVALVPAITVSAVEYGCELPPVLHIPVEVDNAPLPVDQRRTHRDITVRVETVEEPEFVIEFDVDFEPDDEFIEAVNNPVEKVVELPAPKPITKDTPKSERNPRYILRQFIASCESKRIQEYTRNRYAVMGHTNLSKATTAQLGEYAVSLGYSKVALDAMFAKHALGDRGGSRRLGDLPKAAGQ